VLFAGLSAFRLFEAVLFFPEALPDEALAALKAQFLFVQASLIINEPQVQNCAK